MKTFTVNSTILPEKHFHLDFSKNILEIAQNLEKIGYFSIRMPPKSGKTSLLLNLQNEIHRNSENIALYLDFSVLTRNGFSTMEKFFPELHSLLLNNAKLISGKLAQIIYESNLTNRNDLISLIEKLVMAHPKHIYLLIDDAHKHIRKDPFCLFLGLLVKLNKTMKQKMAHTFHGVCITTSESINSFLPVERGLVDFDFFDKWNYPEIEQKFSELTEASLQGYLLQYTKEIEFELDPTTVTTLLEKCKGSIWDANKILKFIHEKVRPYKKQKVLTSNEITHAAGYVLVKGPY